MDLPKATPLDDPGVVASGVTQGNPLTVYIPTDILIETIQLNLVIHEDRAVYRTPEQRAHTDAMIRQRERFLVELEEGDQEAVFVALYRAGVYAE
jgi:hypothetical protein